MKVDNYVFQYVARARQRYGDKVLEMWYYLAKEYGFPLSSDYCAPLSYCCKYSELIQKMAWSDLIEITSYGCDELTTQQKANREALKQAYENYKEGDNGNNND